MKPKLNTLTKWVDGQFGRMQRRFRRTRSGSVLIMVVALLVLLALMGTAYLATARQDRLSAGLIRDNGVTATAARAAADALAQAGTWLTANASQTFTTSATGRSPTQQWDNETNYAGGKLEGGLIGSLIAPRTPDLAPVGPPLDNGKNSVGPFSIAAIVGPAPSGASPPYYFPRWKSLTTPPGFSRFTSPIPSPNTSFPNNFDSPLVDSTHPLVYYTFNDAQDWAVPTSMTITYPAAGYAGTHDLAGQTRTFPAFMKYTWRQTPNPGNPAAPATGQQLVSGPYLAADTMGDGIADAALVPLDIPSTNGVQWFAAWRIVDNAAAINLNTAWGPFPYPVGQAPADAPKGNEDPAGNAFNFFPTDVDLFGFMNSSFSQTNDFTRGAEMATLQARRVVSAVGGTNSDGGQYWTKPYSDLFGSPAGTTVNHTDVSYLYRGEAMWWHLGRRLDFPFAGPLPGTAGDVATGYRRPFDDTDSVALGFHGVMTDPASPQSKIEQIFSKTNSGTALSDSIYRSAMNYMANSADRYDVLPANAIAYWYDWNFNFEGFSGGSLHPSLGIGITASDTFALNMPVPQLGANNPSAPPAWTKGDGNLDRFEATFRTPRTLLTGSNPVLNTARQVDPNYWPPTTQKPFVPIGAAFPSPTALVMTKLPDVPQKVSLNTGTFVDLWRAFSNVFNDFLPEDGNGGTEANAATGYYPLHLHRDYNGWDLRDSKGPFSNVTNQKTIDFAHPVSDPMQLRNSLRDPQLADSTSSGTTSDANDITSTNARTWFDARNMAMLRSALAAVNAMTLRDQHGTMMDVPNHFFAPNANVQAVQLQAYSGSPTAPTSTNVTAYVYGGAPQPFISEVYVDNDTADHSGKRNNKGLIIIKLFNPYPFALPLNGYDLAIVDRSQFQVPTPADGTHGMTVRLISRTNPNAALFGATDTIAAGGYLILTSFDPTNGTNYWPTLQTGMAAPPATAISITGLTDAIGGTTQVDGLGTNPANGCELLLLRPRVASAAHPNIPTTQPGDSAAGVKAALTAEVPVDAFDFSTMVLPTDLDKGPFEAWHYQRMSGGQTVTPTVVPPGAPAGTSVAWKCVYPGPYSGTGNFGNAKANNPSHATATTPTTPLTGAQTHPHFQDTDQAQWGGATGTDRNPWDKGATNGMPGQANVDAPFFHLDIAGGGSYDSPDSTYPNNFPGIQICNVDFGGFNKRDPNTASTPSFPYGGFARVGDVMQVPFIGSYIIFPTADPSQIHWPPALPGASPAPPASVVTEANPVTIDADYADDGDFNDDPVEQVGRFVPIVLNTGAVGTTINDLSPSGMYSPGQATDPSMLLHGTGPNQGLDPSTWRYHFALEVFNQFTVIAKPGEDYFPNMSPDAWFSDTTVAPTSVPPSLLPNTGWAGVEGLVNVNTADWRTLAAVEMIPRSQEVAPAGRANMALAKAIVYYRDVDDGLVHYPWVLDTTVNPPVYKKDTTRPYRRGHGPFNSLAELNNVFYGPPAGNQGFQNGLGALDITKLNDATYRHQWGYYTPTGNSLAAPPATGNLQLDDWLPGNLMVDRVSNLLTTRSDSFTVYVVVQGWRNAYAIPTGNGPWPELVVEKRMAMTVDRSVLTPNSRTLKETAFPTK